MRIVALALCAALLAPMAAQGATPGLGLHVAPCSIGKEKQAALCGTFGVYENRATHAGRIIQLKLVVLKAAKPSHQAIAMIAGGPGESVTPLAPYVADGQYLQAFAPLRKSYDLIFMDDRGMGGSSPLTCSLAPPAQPALYFKQLFPDSLLRACRTALAKTHDLAQYNTNNATDDLDDIRAALGYPKIVLDGGSYGTFFAMIYIRRHPAHVESALLDGVSPPYFQPLPGEPAGVQSAMDDLIAKCKSDAACAKNFPTFAQDFTTVVQQLGRGPVALTVGKGDKAVKVELTKEVFVDHLRQVLYDPDSAAYVPYVISKAARGDYWPLGYILNFLAVGLDQDLTMGAFVNYTCQEWIPFLTEDAIGAAASHSFAGDLRIRAQQHACKLWNVPSMPAAFDDPLRSDAPILMISGSDDPATPPRYAAAALKYLPNAKIGLVKGAGHVTETPCTDTLMVQFVLAKSAKGLDTTSCSAAFAPPHFATSLAGLP